MKAKRFIGSLMALTLAFSLTACGNSGNNEATKAPAATDATKTEAPATTDAGAATDAPAATDAGAATGEAKKAADLKDQAPAYTDINLGTDYTDLKTKIVFLSNRTDLVDDSDVMEKKYIAEFNKLYPDIEVKTTAWTDYKEQALLRLQSDDWGDVMMVPDGIEKKDLSKYFMSYGTVDALSQQYDCINRWTYDGNVYGMPSLGNVVGIVYNKRVFKDAGVTEIPKTPEDFIAALKKIKDKGEAEAPLYTNFVAGWTMEKWDDFIGVPATGSDVYANQTLVHTAEPFSDPGDGTGPYNVYKVLYDAVKEGLTEEDYSTTDWDSSKSMINEGKIGCMVLGSWAVPQMKDAGDNADDIGFMPFPITVNGKQYATMGPDYNYGINPKSSVQNQTAAMLFVKFMVEKSTFAEDLGGFSPLKGSEKPAFLTDFSDVTLLEDQPAVSGEENFLMDLNNESKLNILNGGKEKNQSIVEAAAEGKAFDDLMKEWNQKWKDAHDKTGIKVN